MITATSQGLTDEQVELAAALNRRWKELLEAQREIARLKQRVINLQKENQALSYRLIVAEMGMGKMRSDVNGCSTTPAGQEKYERFTTRGKRMLQYDYRTPEGKLFSCVAKTLEQARIKRDKWLAANAAQ